MTLTTYLLGQFATWTLFLAQAARNLVLFIGYMLLLRRLKAVR